MSSEKNQLIYTEFFKNIKNSELMRLAEFEDVTGCHFQLVRYKI